MPEARRSRSPARRQLTPTTSDSLPPTPPLFRRISSGLSQEADEAAAANDFHAQVNTTEDSVNGKTLRQYGRVKHLDERARALAEDKAKLFFFVGAVLLSISIAAIVVVLNIGAAGADEAFAPNGDASPSNKPQFPMIFCDVGAPVVFLITFLTFDAQ